MLAKRAPRQTRAWAVANRLPGTFGYNVAYLLVGLALAWSEVRRDALVPLGLFVAGTFLAKMQASMADAIHDREADAENPSNAEISRAVESLGVRLAWSILQVETVAALCAFGALAVLTGELALVAVGGAFVLLGFLYSYPPRLKERGVVNHLVTTGVDVCFVVLPVPYLLTGRLSERAVVVGLVVGLYAAAYHVVHQAADVYYDAETGIDTFARSLGVPGSLALGAGLTVAAGLLAGLRGYLVLAVVAVGVGAQYARIYRAARGLDAKGRSAVVSRRFSLARVATLLNGAAAVSLLRHAVM